MVMHPGQHPHVVTFSLYSESPEQEGYAQLILLQELGGHSNNAELRAT